MTRFLIAVEDELSEIVSRRLLLSQGFEVETCYGKQGFGYLKRNIEKFQRAARSFPVFVLTDLDQAPCAAALKQEWRVASTQRNFVFRVAVRAVESWIMADRENFADFLGAPLKRIPQTPDAEPNPKRLLIELARKSKKRDIRDDLAPKPNSAAKVGRNYNARLGSFAKERWNISSARANSQSLERAMRALENFKSIA